MAQLALRKTFIFFFSNYHALSIFAYDAYLPKLVSPRMYNLLSGTIDPSFCAIRTDWDNCSSGNCNAIRLNEWSLIHFAHRSSSKHSLISSPNWSFDFCFAENPKFRCRASSAEEQKATAILSYLKRTLERIQARTSTRKSTKDFGVSKVPRFR